MNNFVLHFHGWLVGFATAHQLPQRSRTRKSTKTSWKSFNYRGWREVSAGAALINQRCRSSLPAAAESEVSGTELGARPESRLE